MAAERNWTVHSVLLLCSLLLASLLGFLLWSMATSGSGADGWTGALAAILLVGGILALIPAVWIGGARAPVDYTAPTWVTVTPMYDLVRSPGWRRDALRVENESTIWAVLGLLLLLLGAALYASVIAGALAVGCGLAVTVTLTAVSRRDSRERHPKVPQP